MLNRLNKTAAALTASLMLGGCGANTFNPLYQSMPQTGYQSDYTNGARTFQQEQMPVLPKGVEARGLQLTPGTASARVGQSLPFQVAVKGSDNKVYSDPRLVNWTLSNTQMGQVDRNGVFLPQTPGTVKIVAMIGTVSAEATVQIEQARYAWQQVLSPSTKSLRAVKMVAKNEAWAGGDNGTLLRFINGAWHVEPSFRQGDATVRGLGFSSTAAGWAVGSRAGGSVPFVCRWDGVQWTNVNLPVKDGFLNAISVVNERDAWAVGQDGGGDALILHFDGASWKQYDAPGGGKLNDIQMLTSRSGWAVGKSGGRTPLILKFSNGSWEKKNMWDNRGTISLTDSQELTAIKMVSETQGYAVGTRDNLLINPRGLFLQYEPKRDGWTTGAFDSATEGLDQVPLHDIEMISGTEGWALGEVRRPDYTVERNPKSIFGNLLANVGGVLKVDTNYFTGNVSGAFYAIDLLPAGEGFVVGEGGYILQRTYDWRGISNGSTYNSGGYGSTGSSPSANMPVTNGPGGSVVPGTNQTSGSNTYY